MNAEGTVPAAVTAEDPESPLYCYRHPDRETWVRCGRCDQPICSRCAMQGPVGFRCRECGRPARDPLTSIRPGQLAVVLAIAAIGGLLIGLLSTRIGFFGLLLAWFGGGLIADAVIRAVGFKRGPRMLAMLFGGIVLGSLGGVAADLVSFVASFGPGGADLAGPLLLDRALWVALAAGVACFGAWSRLRL